MGDSERVYIECATEESRIAYTTDGSEPLAENAKDSQRAEVEVKVGDTLKVRAFRDNWRPSELVVVTYERAKAPDTGPETPKPATSKPSTSKPATSKPSTSKPASKPATALPVPG